MGVEANFDGLVGPTHHYGGLGRGNVASARHGGHRSNPRAAAWQGLAKMRRVAELGGDQGVLPPHERPDISTLRRLGFTGTETDVLDRARREAPELLSACSSASAMWAANAATVTPSADSGDGRLHVTPANLVSQLHRSLEPETTARVLEAIFPDSQHFAHHPPLPATLRLADEGAANHTRLAPRVDGPGLELFVYGREALASETPRRHTPRQTRDAAEAVARLHGLPRRRVLFLRQSPDAIDAGVFHNDVAAVGHRNVFLYHERAFLPGDVGRLCHAYRSCFGEELVTVEVKEAELPLSEAVDTYLFNSQLLSLADDTTALLCPAECAESPRAADVLARVRDGPNPVAAVHPSDVRQSMRNGGGPACLRLRVLLTAEERAASHAPVYFTPTLHETLGRWVDRHFRPTLRPADLADPKLLTESRTALDELTRILGLGAVYPFQRRAGGGEAP